MVTQEKMNAMKRIRDEFFQINNNPILNIGAVVSLPNEDNIFEWESTILGPKDTSYRGGIFALKIQFPENYPQKGPEVVFKTPIYHLNSNF